MDPELWGEVDVLLQAALEVRALREGSGGREEGSDQEGLGNVLHVFGSFLT